MWALPTRVSDACQIKDLDHRPITLVVGEVVSDACQIKDLDHTQARRAPRGRVSDACQIKDLDHQFNGYVGQCVRFRCLSDQRLRPL